MQNMNSDAQIRRGEIRRQIVLPFSKSLEIAFKSLKVRFFRSLITVGSLMLAVSFLAYVLVNLDIASGIYTQAAHAQGHRSGMISGMNPMVRQLVKAGYVVNEEAGTVSAGAKERWIVILSMLVCTVGILNAQFMSVTERFREIGVYKCLGALDGMILRLFLLEAGMMGFAGALAGALLGLVFALAGGAFSFGLTAFAGLQWQAVLLSLAESVGAGVTLSLIGVFYPALLAARMRPIIAIKAEH